MASAAMSSTSMSFTSSHGCFTAHDLVWDLDLPCGNSLSSACIFDVYECVNICLSTAATIGCSVSISLSIFVIVYWHSIVEGNIDADKCICMFVCNSTASTNEECT